MGVRSELASSRPLRILASATVVNSAGNGAFAATAVVYLNQVEHLRGSVIGAVFTLAAIAALLLRGGGPVGGGGIAPSFHARSGLDLYATHLRACNSSSTRFAPRWSCNPAGELLPPAARLTL